eukprot:TRINITY_DN7595_c0_g1_i3.p1 TRINITY_DN7595_c0_g1~~TRINITY_DN7595_c0_g1_i3.p1  ORF type:complete len:239 (-),score=33.96 TRINITY_DN7595_c0_g1_i3:103-747(-)
MASSSNEDSLDPDAVECRIVSMGGSQVTVDARKSSKVWELKEDICCALEVPEYEQHLYLDTVKMHSKAALSSFTSTSHDAPLKITLVRSRLPDCLSHHVASLLWQGFLAFGGECGETMHEARMVSLLRFAGLFDCADLASKTSELPTLLTFPQCVAYVADLKEALATTGGAENRNEDGVVLQRGIRRFEDLDLDLQADARLMMRRRQGDNNDAQ